MKKRLLVICMTIACAFALCFALAGCGASEEDFDKNFIGAWELESIEDEEMGHIDTAILKQMDMTVSLTVNEDGSADFIAFNESADCTWVATSATTMTLTIAGDGDSLFELQDGKLVGDDGETKLTFVKTSA